MFTYFSILQFSKHFLSRNSANRVFLCQLHNISGSSAHPSADMIDNSLCGWLLLFASSVCAILSVTFSRHRRLLWKKIMKFWAHEENRIKLRLLPHHSPLIGSVSMLRSWHSSSRSKMSLTCHTQTWLTTQNRFETEEFSSSKMMSQGHKAERAVLSSKKKT